MFRGALARSGSSLRFRFRSQSAEEAGSRPLMWTLSMDFLLSITVFPEGKAVLVPFDEELRQAKGSTGYVFTSHRVAHCCRPPDAL
jgi:hypothetical protein